LAAAFASEYRRLYHAVLPEYEPMALNWRLRAFGPEPDLRLPSEGQRRANERPDAPMPRTHRSAYFPEAGGFRQTPVYDRAALPRGVRIDGPAIIEERESTSVIWPGDRVRVDTSRNLRITLGEGR
jgi:N-methylhydantoinase A/oxoprolinase/acetone carboxylase beta subunit